jgi:drug/metabolite transporter (DMT)-like permease
MFGMVVLSFTLSVLKTSLANATFVFYASDLVISFLLGTLLLHESVSRPKLLAILLAFIGLGFYAHAIWTLTPGIVWGLLAGVFDSTSNMIRKQLSGIDRMAVLRLQYGVTTVFVLLVTVLSHETAVRHFTIGGALLTIVYGSLLIIVGNLLLYGFQHFDVNVGTVLLSSELVFALLVGIIGYGEVPTPQEMIGGIFILAASVLSGLGPKLKARFN